MHCCHGDGDPSNNELENLRWDYPEGNASDAKRHGRVRFGEDSPHSKLTTSDVREIRQRRSEGVPLKVLAKKFGVNPSCVSKVASKTHWKEVADAT